MSNFITNQPTKDLKSRLVQLISRSKEMKFLVGFFYFSGIRELYKGLKDNNNFILKVLVGLDVSNEIIGLVEYANHKKFSDEEKINNFFQSVRKSINSDLFDTQEFYEQVRFFIELIVENKLIIRKTSEPNHSKIYLFKLEEDQIGRNRLFITGSSNLTKSGLTLQNEFNVEISDYGFDEAENYFDTLWENAIQLTEKDDLKNQLIQIIEQETHIKKITPFEAYCLVVHSYIESSPRKDIGNAILEILERNGYKKYQYQLDAVKQALSIIEQHNGVLIADVVGLGKTIIACAVAKHLRARGIVICPPGLIGDENKTEGWKKYLDQFQLYDWEVRSLGDLENTLQFVNSRDDIEVVIVDEAHRFRNQDTQSYELLKNICRNKKVILLTATPFNNKPEDILSLLSLFIIPKQSSITLDSNLVAKFRHLNRLFEDLAIIKKYHNSKDRKKRGRALEIYQSLFEEEQIDLTKVKRKTNYLAKQIRSIIEPVTIRRNRLDLTKNPLYKNEVKNLSKVEDPQEWFYELTTEQSKFYDEIITKYFADPDDGGKFTGAIYRPFEYETGLPQTLFDLNLKRKMEENREYIQQRNLFDIMRRLIVKRFESSFGAFRQSIENFKQITNNVLMFIEKTGKDDPLNGEYILDRDLLENLLDLEPEEIEERLIRYEKQIAQGVYPKKHKRYKIKDFKSGKEFIEHIKSDLKLFDEILERLDQLKLLENDPKVECLIKNIKNEISKKPNGNEPKRKIVIFSEYADTVEYVHHKLQQLSPEIYNRTLAVTGAIPETKISLIIKNFDASSTEQLDNYDILLSTDKLSEGFNLNRAGMVINYDIPWNPVRVIQRLGRINRISKKVFDSLYIVNFFPTEKGSEIVKSREIAQNKMFLIHNTLGEDSKIFDIDEEPSASRLYKKIMQNPENLETESFDTLMYQTYFELKEKYPEIMNSINNMPKRIKVAKPADDDEMIVVFKKSKLFVSTAKKNANVIETNETSLELVFDKIKCDPGTPDLGIDDEFWNYYEKVKETKSSRDKLTEQSIENRALNTLKYLLNIQGNEKLTELKKFIRTLKEDIIDYGTLPDYTLRRIANINNSEEKLDEAISELNELRKELGEDYLEKEKAKINQQDRELIIAIMNKKIVQ